MIKPLDKDEMLDRSKAIEEAIKISEDARILVEQLSQYIDVDMAFAIHSFIIEKNGGKIEADKAAMSVAMLAGIYCMVPGSTLLQRETLAAALSLVIHRSAGADQHACDTNPIWRKPAG